METVDQFRFDVSTLAEAQARTGTSTDAAGASFGTVPGSFFRRRIVAFRLAPGHRLLDVRSPETHATVLREKAGALRDLGVGPRLTLGDLLGSDYRLPRVFTRWAIDHGFDGIAYPSCHDLEMTCAALFESSKIVPISEPEEISPQDNDLIEVAGLWRLSMPF